MEASEKAILKLSSLVMVNAVWISKTKDKIIKNFVGYCSGKVVGYSSGRFVFSGISLGKSHEIVNNHQDILVSALAPFKMN